MVDNQVYPVEASPDDEVPGRPVPKSAEKHGDHYVDVSSNFPATVPTERDVKVIPQKG